jgi:glutathione S-transferase
MPQPQIIGAPQSPFVWTCRMACTEKGVAYGLTPVMPHTPEVDAVHPLGRIPVFHHGDVALFESRAICLYVDRVFDGPALVPTEPLAAAQTEQWVSLMTSSAFPAIMPFFGAYFFPGTADGSPNRAVIDTAMPRIEPVFVALDRAVAKTGQLAGDKLSLADFYLTAMLYYSSRLPETTAMLGRLPDLRAHFDRHIAVPSIKATVPPPFPGRSN